MRTAVAHKSRQRLFFILDMTALVAGLTWIYFGYWLSGLGSLFMSIYFQNLLSMSRLEERVDNIVMKGSI